MNRGTKQSLAEPCEAWAESLVAYADGELSEKDAAAVAAHLQECAACRTDYEATLRLKQVAQQWRLPAESVSLQDSTADEDLEAVGRLMNKLPVVDLAHQTPTDALLRELTGELKATREEMQAMRAKMETLRRETAELRRELARRAPAGHPTATPVTLAPYLNRSAYTRPV